MKKTILGLGLVFILTSAGFAQKVDSKASSTINNSTSVSKNGGNVGLQSEMQIMAQLQNSIDVKKAKVGDQVILKTTKAIKQNGKIVVDKGATLFGRVTEVQRKTKDNTTSKIGILFDRLQQGGNQLPINATITSIMQVQSQTSIDDDSINSDISGSSSTGTSTQSSGGSSRGGVLGGIGSAVGGAVNATTQAVGKVANSAGQTVKDTAHNVGGTLKDVQISQSTDASTNAGSTLSLQNGNLRLYKGITFNLNVSESSSIRSN